MARAELCRVDGLAEVTEPADTRAGLDARCSQTTARGRPCRNRPSGGSDRCSTHLRSAAAKSGEQTGDGRVQPAHRPDTITEAVTKNLETLLSAGNYIVVACQVCAVPRSTFNDWMVRGSRDGDEFEHYRQFRTRMERAMAAGEATRVRQIAAAGKDDWRAAAWMLERSAPERWAKPSQRAHAADDRPKDPEGAAAQGSTLGELLSQVNRGLVQPNRG